ncbi:MAG: AraC family transcriptional regulator [Bradyrhizobium sp.]|nr:AraC family transcriptional regulator [Bradyrhizobium sp.]
MQEPIPQPPRVGRLRTNSWTAFAVETKKLIFPLNCDARHKTRRRVGLAFRAHVTELRLKHALMLLTAYCGKDRISDIALRAGFSDISHFNRLFRCRFGETPKGIRANHQVCHAD